MGVHNMTTVAFGAAPSDMVDQPKTIQQKAVVAGLADALHPGLMHAFIVAPRSLVYNYLRRCIRTTNTSRAIVFMNYQRRLKEAEVRLQKRKSLALLFTDRWANGTEHIILKVLSVVTRGCSS